LRRLYDDDHPELPLSSPGGVRRTRSVEKQRVRERLPLVLSVSALVVALLGVTPLGEAAGSAVRVALFAKNAGKVSGIKASRRPRPGHLVPLGADGQFPDSVAPRGAQGPRGETGPPGPAGPPVTRFYAVVNADGTLHRGTGVLGTRRDAVGKYTVTFSQAVDECVVLATVGGHRTGETTWTGVDEGVAAAASFGAAVEVHTLKSGGFNEFALRDWNFQLAAFC
jgi:hypothetical protein